MAKMHFRFGAMGSAKTAQALMHAYNFREKGNKVLLAKPATDTRTSEIWSRIGLKQDGISMDELVDMDFFDLAQYKVIIIDEAQFVEPAQVDFLARIADNLDIPVFAYGLRTDYTGHLFEGSKRFMELADEIEEIKTSCWCGASAKMNARIENGKILHELANPGTNVDIENESGEQKYTALCRKHYMSGEYVMPQQTEEK